MLGTGLRFLLGASILVALYAISQRDFLVFHCLTEAFSICIAIAVFAIFWNTRQFLDNGIYLVIGLGCLFAGVLDLVYIFAYHGMSVFPGADGNIALQAKTVAQWYVSLSCLAAALFLRRKINQNLALFVYSTLLALALASIFYWRVFPACLTEDARVTPFERMGLVVSCSAYVGALLLLVRNRREFDGYVFGLLAATLIAFFIEDSACAVATEMNGFARTVAHLCQVVALYFVYKAFVQVGLTKPYDLLFRSQQQSAEALERQQQFLETVLDNAQSGIIACDANGVPTLSNRAFREFHGIRREGTFADRREKLFDLYHADGKTLMRLEESPLFRALRGEHIHDAEVVVVPKIGPRRTMVASGEPLLGKDGANHGAVLAVHDITDRKRAEEALRQSEEGLRLVLEACGFGWWNIDLVTGAMTADDRCKALFGLPPATEPSFALFLAQILPEDHPVAEQHLAEATIRASDCEAEYRTIWPDGSLHWLLIKGRSFHDVPGRPFFRGVVMDMTSRKRAEDALRESEERYRRLFETESDAIFVMDCQSLRIEDANAAALSLYGYSRQECLALGISDLSAEPERTLETIGRRETHTPLRRHRKKDGTVFLVEIVGSYFEYQGARSTSPPFATSPNACGPRRRCGPAKSVTEFWSRAFRNSPGKRVPMARTSTAINVGMSTRGSLPPRSTTTVGWPRFIPTTCPPRSSACGANDKGEPSEIEYRVRRAADGSYRWHLSRTVPVRDQDGRITGWIGCATDIEDLKQAQEILKLAHDEQLQRHQAELAHVARLSMMGELVASLAHELTQPLHAINGYACGSVRRVRKRLEEDPELVAALEQISKEAVRAAEVIRRVRAFVRKRKPCPAKVFVNHLIEEILPFSKAELERRHAKMVLDLAEFAGGDCGPDSDRTGYHEPRSQWLGSHGRHAGRQPTLGY